MDASEKKRKKVRILLTVWGSKYYEYLSSFSLPSWLSPNNLPALAALFDVEVDVLTRQSDADEFSRIPAFEKLRAVCPINFISIDDLISPGMYSVTLTTAFGRGIIRHGAEMTDISFIFMNADFILTDGSLAHLGRLIQRGEGAIMAPSYRAVEEDVAPVLADRMDKERGYIDIEPRNLVRLALKSPHPTTVAKFVTQQGCVSLQPNQIYWRVDDATVIGRYLLMFMLCIKPARVVSHINSYCDYSFIQNFRSLDDVHAIVDSDDFFMLELQSHNFERLLLRAGSNTPEHVAETARSWTTALHHTNMKHELIFHGGELPEAYQLRSMEARAFTEAALSKMGSPIDHVGHHQWIAGLQNWRARALPRRIPDELNHPDNADGFVESGNFRLRIAGFLAGLKRRFDENIPLVPMWHFHWTSYHRFSEEIARRGRSSEILFVHDADFKPNGVRMLAAKGMTSLTREQIVAGTSLPSLNAVGFAAILIGPDNMLQTNELVRRIRQIYPHVADMAICCPLYLAALPQTHMPISSVLRDIDKVLPTDANGTELIFFRSRAHTLAHAIVIGLSTLAGRSPRMAHALTLALSPFLTLLCLAGSLCGLLPRPAKTTPAYATSLLIKAVFDTSSNDAAS